MTARVAVYIEGGGDSRALQEPLKRGFTTLFRKAIRDENDLRIITCGSRNATYRDFKIAFEQNRYELSILLLDSEGPVPVGQWAWEYFSGGPRLDDKNFHKPTKATDDHAHLMVEMMEAWFIADVAAFRIIYGQNLQIGSLSKASNIESIPKHTLLPSLQNATRQTLKGPFKKTHGPELVSELNVSQLRQRSTHADRLFRVLQNHLGKKT